jgi:hypothetical protein
VVCLDERAAGRAPLGEKGERLPRKGSQYESVRNSERVSRDVYEFAVRRDEMKRRKLFIVVTAAMVLCHPACRGNTSRDAADEKIGLRVLYVGYPGTEREKDFVGFLEKHFTKVGKADLEKVEAKDAEGYDVVIVDYSGLTIKGNAIITPRVPFGREYSRPVLTIGAAGALVCDMHGLKTGYL